MYMYMGVVGGEWEQVYKLRLRLFSLHIQVFRFACGRSEPLTHTATTKLAI